MAKAKTTIKKIIEILKIKLFIIYAKPKKIRFLLLSLNGNIFLYRYFKIYV